MSSISVFAIPKTFTNLSVPSVIFADAVWYGSVRGGVQTGGGADDPKYSSFGSRWGIKGSSEVSEGLTSVYKFETRVGQGDASQNTNQLYVGLSGGFGSITLGKQSSAAYNHSGAIRDISNWHSHGDTTGSRISNALSYSYAAESFSMQVAAIMDGDTDTDGAIDRAEFGMTVGLGDIGKVAIGYEKQEDSMMAGMPVKGAMPSANNGSPVSLDAKDGIKDLDKTVWHKATGDMAIVDGEVSDVTYMMGMDTAIMAVEVTYSAGETAPMAMDTLKMDGDNYYSMTCEDADARKAAGDCTSTTHVWMKTTVAAPAAEADAGVASYAVAGVAGDTVKTTATVTPTDTTFGHKSTHISASFGLAGITVGLGHTSTDSNDPAMGAKAKTNFLGASGGIGDSGLSWNAWGRNVEGHDGKETSPWTVGLAKSLGGGATTFIEHTNADDGEDGTTSIALRVDF